MFIDKIIWNVCICIYIKELNINAIIIIIETAGATEFVHDLLF